MTSLQLFEQSRTQTAHDPIDWGTGELRRDKFDTSVHRGPTFLLKNQPISQVYRKSNLELSNVRAHDQLMPKPLEENLLDVQNPKKTVMNHPFTSQISYKALFPNFVPPEDGEKGELALKSPSLTNCNLPKQVENYQVMSKFSGQPYRHEIRYTALPSQQQGQLYYDKEYYHIPKPDNSQRFYPAPPKLLAPNPKLRASNQTVNPETAKTILNKQKQLIQSTNRIDYYKDGFGTRAPLNSSDFEEKNGKFEPVKHIDDEMRPYFRRGEALTQFTINPNDQNDQNIVNYALINETAFSDHSNHKIVLTQLEKDELRFLYGNNYNNYPEKDFQNNPKLSSYTIIENAGKHVQHINLDDPSIGVSSKNLLNEPANTFDAERVKINCEHQERQVLLETANRKKQIDLINPGDDIKLLRLKNKELENSRGAHPNLKQNVTDHTNTLYKHEGKYLGERSQLYQTHVYKPLLLKQYVDAVKDHSTPNIESLTLSKKLFAHKVFNDHMNLKREPKERLLTHPKCDAKTEENGFVLKQTTYGNSYNTKKFLQQHQLDHSSREYRKLDQAVVEHQDIVLKSRIDQVALQQYLIGSTSQIDLKSATELVDKADERNLIEEYPRLKGPIAPEPYETLYCSNQIGEHSDGYAKRQYHRVYESPNSSVPSESVKYEPLRTDIEAMQQYEVKALKDAEDNELYLKQLNEKMMNMRSYEINHMPDIRIPRRKEYQKLNVTTYSADFTPYEIDTQKQACPPNQFSKSVDYTESTSKKLKNGKLPRDLTDLQDRWSKTIAIKRFHSAHPLKSIDLRDNIHSGKKIIKESPLNAARFAQV